MNARKLTPAKRATGAVRFSKVETGGPCKPRGNLTSDGSPRTFAENQVYVPAYFALNAEKRANGGKILATRHADGSRVTQGERLMAVVALANSVSGNTRGKPDAIYQNISAVLIEISRMESAEFPDALAYVCPGFKGGYCGAQSDKSDSAATSDALFVKLIKGEILIRRATLAAARAVGEPS